MLPCLDILNDFLFFAYKEKSPLAISFALNVKTLPMHLKTSWIISPAVFLSRQTLVIWTSEQAYASLVHKHSAFSCFPLTLFPEQAILFHINNANYSISYLLHELIASLVMYENCIRILISIFF